MTGAKPSGGAALRSAVEKLLDRLSTFDGGGLPVVSLTLDARPDQHGRDHFDAFVRKTFAAQLEALPPRSPERASVARDQARIAAWLAESRDPAANGIGIWACDAVGLFTTIQLAAPFPGHNGVVAPRPWVVELARLLDRCPRTAVLLVDASVARLLVFGHGVPPAAERILEGARPPRTAGQLASPAHVRRALDEAHARHAREAAAFLDLVVREEDVRCVVVAGDVPVRPMVRAALSRPVAERLVAELPLDPHAPVHVARDAALAAVRTHRAREADALAARVLGAAGAHGRAAAGVAAVRAALGRGQVDVLVLADRVEQIGDPDAAAPDAAALADRLIADARRTSAAVTFVPPDALAAAEGVAAILRYPEVRP